jgi:hypothetical protein
MCFVGGIVKSLFLDVPLHDGTKSTKLILVIYIFFICILIIIIIIIVVITRKSKSKVFNQQPHQFISKDPIITIVFEGAFEVYGTVCSVLRKVHSQLQVDQVM